MITLDQFNQPAPLPHIDRVPVPPSPITNYPLAAMVATECKAKYPDKDVWIESDGSPEKDATMWYVWRCLY